MNPSITSNELRSQIEAENKTWIAQVAEQGHPVDLADKLSSLDQTDILFFLAASPALSRTLIFSEFDNELQQQLAAMLSTHQFAQIVTLMSHDARADLFASLPRAIREMLLPALAYAEREDIRKLAAYPEDSSGAIMTSDYTTLEPQQTVEEAVISLRRQALDRETIYYSYVCDAKRTPIGIVTLKKLVLSDPEVKVEDLMHRELIFARVDDDREEAAQKLRHYDLLALPVVDASDELVGIITYDDAMDVLQQEHVEDLEKFMAITGGHKVGEYLKTSSWTHFKNRISWILLLALLGLASGYVLHSFEATLSSLVILALYMPMMADTGGNTGSQTAAVVIQALTLKEVRPADVLKVLGKECKVAAMIASVVGLMAMGKVWLFSYGAELPPEITLFSVSCVVALAIAVQIVSSTLIGALLPLAASRLRLDPALVASPALTTIVDFTGLLIYFFIARLMLFP